VGVIDEVKIAQAMADLALLVTPAEINGRQFLDIGSGSGLSALAAARMGAGVCCTDIDPDSIEATRTLLGHHLPSDAWTAEVVSVFDLGDRKYDIVHSWGVLHHTGDMWRAIEKAAQQLAKAA
jgi:2-polyprenyl-6-hydroxyphenyl methylase/3-demethylubiquinone-9 3-methyltransferase